MQARNASPCGSAHIDGNRDEARRKSARPGAKNQARHGEIEFDDVDLHANEQFGQTPQAPGLGLQGTQSDGRPT